MPDVSEIPALFDRAQNHQLHGRLDEALAGYDSILAIKWDIEEVHINKASLLHGLNRPDEALRSLDAAIQINPGAAEAHNNRGFVLQALGRFEEAVASLDHAIALQPDFADAYNNRGASLRALQRLEAALQDYERTITLQPNYAEAWNNRAALLMALRKPDAAFQACQRAVELMPQNAEILSNASIISAKAGRSWEAKAFLESLTAVAPGHKSLLGGLADVALAQLDWKAQAALRPRLLAECSDGSALVPPFTLLGYDPDPSVLRIATANYLQDAIKAMPAASHVSMRPHDRIRLAYVSADFHDHPVAQLLAGLFARHDRSRFEVYGVSLSAAKDDPMRARMMRAFDQFHDAERLGDAETAALMRELEVDIAVDLNGFTNNARPGIFVRRAAPVQVNYLGYAGTMASDCWDYIITDPVAVPCADQPFYAERIVHLPHCYMPTDATPIERAPPGRADAGLPDGGFVFCCFNGHAKITGPVFDIWMRLLHAIPPSVLWLAEGGGTAILRQEAQKRGIDDRRLVFAPKVSRDDYRARIGLADLFLDTLPYNAHSTASDVLWAGVPLITCRGNSFAGRVAASLLSAAGLPELITDDLDAYEKRVLYLARDQDELLRLRQKLAANRLTAPLFNADRFRNALEAAFETIAATARRGEPPMSFNVPA